ncbi:hypothetical protein NM208_g3583 [Fusarium decemcellulare]|uniref:Uncharacterized protein n=1 Tax=Fusarium decemcellulare TaxID=57161 RepID=A0ACC1SNS1_9HYPO|nr:hypothetical protein NM208_g3583 [Fusarium decemcellulare]
MTWEKPYLATSYGPFCHGNTLNLPGFSQHNITYPEDEDCLTLNVVCPSRCSDSEAQVLPILVWIYGGGFLEGGSGDVRYNMSYLVKTSVEMGKPIIQPQLPSMGRLALRWIQENARAFGGNPRRVTVQGESAGAASIGFHLRANHGRDDGLFQRSQNSMLESLGNTTGCTNRGNIISCLRSIPAAQLANASSVGWNPILDSELIPGLPSAALAKGKFNPVPTLIGANTNEGAPFMPMLEATGTQTQEDFQDALITFCGTNLSSKAQAKFQELYLETDKAVQQRELGTVLSNPGKPYGRLYGSISQLLGDLFMNAGRRITAEAWSRSGADVYSYRFDTVPAGISPELAGATHFGEVAFVFHNTNGGGYERNPFAVTDPDVKTKYIKLSELMSLMWISFVNTGSPNDHGVVGSTVSWPRHDMKAPRNIVFNAQKGVTVEKDVFRAEAIRLILDTADSLPR